MQIKKYLKIASIFIVLLAMIGVWFLARKLVENGYSVSEKIKEDVTGQETCVKIEFNKDSGINDRKTPLFLFNNSDIDIRQKQFLGGKYSDYEEALKEIKGNYKNKFKNLKQFDYSLMFSEDEILDIGWGFYDYLDINELSQKEAVTFRDCLTVVGMYGETCIVYDYMYDESDRIQLLAVDYSNTLFSTDNYLLYDFGQLKNVFAYMNGSSYERYGDVDVLYVKAI